MALRITPRLDDHEKWHVAVPSGWFVRVPLLRPRMLEQSRSGPGPTGVEGQELVENVTYTL